jgi:hypothetical protein
MSALPSKRLMLSAIPLAFTLLIACVSTSDVVIDASYTHPTVFKNSLDDAISIYANRLEIGGAVYPGVNCSTEEFNCIIFEPIGAIITPRDCANTDWHKWGVGAIKANLISFYPHIYDLILSTENHSNFAFTFSDDPDIGVWEIYYLTDENHNSTALQDLFNSAGALSEFSVRYQKEGLRSDGLPIFACKVNDM